MAIVALGSRARAQPIDPLPAPLPSAPEVAQPEPAYPPPPPAWSSPSPSPTWPSDTWPPPREALASRPPPPDPFERHRHFVGAQLGGTGVLQFVYRYRAFGPLHLEVGGLGADHVGNASVGVLVAAVVSRRMFLHAGLGGAWAAAFGPKSPDGCTSAKASDCPAGESSDTMLFVHVRAGLGFTLGRSRRQLLAVDVGAWFGRELSSRTDSLGLETHWSTPVRTPMAGFSYFFAL